jgi:hypothetical protein
MRCIYFIDRECPLALEAMTGLMSLGVKGPDVAALVMNGAPNTSDWSVFQGSPWAI